MSEANTFALHYHRDLPVLDVAGEVDIANAQEFEVALDRAGSNGAALVVSLNDTSYFDSKGIHVLLVFAGRVSRAGQRLALVAKDGSAPRRLLEIAGVPGVVPTYSTVDDAVAALGDPPVITVSIPQTG